MLRHLTQRPRRTIVHLLTTLAVLASSFGVGHTVADDRGTGSDAEPVGSASGVTEPETTALDPEAARRSLQPLESPGLPGGTWVSAGEPDTPPEGDDPPLPSDPEAISDDSPGDSSGEPPGDEPADDEPAGEEPIDAPLELPDEPFVDPCADGDADGCPPGEPGTIIGDGGSASEAFTDGLEFTIHPYLTKAEYPELRCDPGFLTPDGIPLVVTTNRPVTGGHITIGSPATGRGADRSVELVNRLSTDSAQRAAWVLADALASEAPSAGLEHGLHHCARLPHELAEPVGTLEPESLVLLEVDAADIFDDYRRYSAERSFVVRDLTGVATERPPVHVEPMDWDVVQVRVPRKGPGSSSDYGTLVQAEPAPDDPDETSCTTYPRYRPVERTADARPLDRETLSDPDYPYHRGYDHQTVWNLVLREGTTYDICVYWSGREVDREAWRVTTPNQLRLRTRITDVFAHKEGRTVQTGDWNARTIGIEGCGPVAVPEQEGIDTRWWRPVDPPWTCDSNGRKIRPEHVTVELTANRHGYHFRDPLRVPFVDPDADDDPPRTRGCTSSSDRVSTPIHCPERTIHRSVELDVISGLCGGTGGCTPPTDTWYEVIVEFDLYDGPRSAGTTWDDWNGPTPIETTL